MNNQRFLTSRNKREGWYAGKLWGRNSDGTVTMSRSRTGPDVECLRLSRKRQRDMCDDRPVFDWVVF